MPQRPQPYTPGAYAQTTPHIYGRRLAARIEGERDALLAILADTQQEKAELLGSLSCANAEAAKLVEELRTKQRDELATMPGVATRLELLQRLASIVEHDLDFEEYCNVQSSWLQRFELANYCRKLEK